MLVLSFVLALLGAVAASAAPRVSVIERYALEGYEVWFTPTVGTFVGAGASSDTSLRRLSGWYASIAHDEVIIPSGRITGGTATLYRLDGVRIHGSFTDGLARQTVPGENCTTEQHVVSGVLSGVTKSDAPGLVGVGFFNATLTHYRVRVFGRCYSYSASVAGSISIAV